ncbi:MAG: DUF3857 domain-containing protein [Patiriisocius sp.]|uniref:DUF3857 domain-containing protein n=1 Tax=Patiriisocius sp. TaxID=2822396 RepID=UPI003EF5C231
MKNKFYTLLCILVAQISLAQTPFYETYTWDDSPKYDTVNLGDEDLVTLQQKIVTEFIFEKDDSFIEYYLEHEIVFLNSDEVIEGYNKIYLPYSNSSEIIVNMARVIDKNGKVIVVDKSKIFDSVDEETGNKVQYFALEGIEKGSVVERLYVYKRYPQYQGKRITLQSEFPKKNVSFDLYGPSNLQFQFKSYNGLPEVELEDVDDNKLHWSVSVPSVAGLEDEETSAYWASKKYLVYNLYKNLTTQKVGISGYSAVVKNIYPFYYPEKYDKRTTKSLKKFLSQATGNVKSGEPLLRNLDSYIKTNIFLAENSSDDLKDLEQVLNKKVANGTGVIKLYVAALRALGVKHELVVTTNRFNTKFDKDFESQNFLNEFLFYFPEFDTYLSPTDYESRYGFPPAQFTDNYGLFIKEVALGDFKSGVGEVRYIDAIDAEKSTDTMIIDVKFDAEDLSKTTIELDHSMTGYYAGYIQPFIHLAKQEDRDNLTESFAKRLKEDVKINNMQMNNGNPESFGVAPFQVVVNFDSEAFVEKAGNKYLFKVGDLIGSQMELYQEKKRVLPVESEFNRTYLRTINVEIPEGYQVANLEDLNIDHSFEKDGQPYFAFDSHYKMNGNTLEITADEYYKVNIVPANLYEEYRTVINSAADFNKVTLVLEPK